MPSSLLQRLFSQVVDRLAVLTLGGLAASSEADAAVHEAECLDRLEEAARRYEAAGKPQLADRLRSRASQLTIDDPTAMARASLMRLESPEPDRPLTLPTAHDAPDASNPPQKRRRRRSAQGGEGV